MLVAVTAPRSAAFYAGQLAALREAGAIVYFLSSPSEDVAAHCAREGATFVPIAMERAPAPWRDARALATITRTLRGLDLDLVNAGTPKAGLLVTLAARAARVPARVHTLHGLRYEAATGPMRRALWAAQRLSCDAATDVVCVSASLRARAIETGLVTGARAVVLGDGSINGIDTDRFRLDDAARAAGAALRARTGIAADAPVAGYLGRIARDKGVAELLSAWAQTRRPGWHLLVGGDVDDTDPPSAETLEALRGAADVHWIGEVADAVAFHAAIDVLVLPSRREGFPTAPLEAAALGRPTIATRVTGCVDAVVDGVTGALVTLGDPAALATAIARYLGDAALRRAHGDAARARVIERFSRERVHALTLAYYDRVLGTRASSRRRGG